MGVLSRILVHMVISIASQHICCVPLIITNEVFLLLLLVSSEMHFITRDQSLILSLLPKSETNTYLAARLQAGCRCFEPYVFMHMLSVCRRGPLSGFTKRIPFQLWIRSLPLKPADFVFILGSV